MFERLFQAYIKNAHIRVWTQWTCYRPWKGGDQAFISKYSMLSYGRESSSQVGSKMWKKTMHTRVSPSKYRYGYGFLILWPDFRNLCLLVTTFTFSYVYAKRITDSGTKWQDHLWSRRGYRTKICMILHEFVVQKVLGRDELRGPTKGNLGQSRLLSNIVSSKSAEVSPKFKKSTLVPVHGWLTLSSVLLWLVKAGSVRTFWKPNWM